MTDEDLGYIDAIAPGSDGVKLFKRDGRLMVRAYNQGGHDCVEIDVMMLIEALRRREFL